MGGTGKEKTSQILPSRVSTIPWTASKWDSLKYLLVKFSKRRRVFKDRPHVEAGDSFGVSLKTEHKVAASTPLPEPGCQI